LGLKSWITRRVTDTEAGLPYRRSAPISIPGLAKVETTLENLLSQQPPGSVDWAKTMELATKAAGCRVNGPCTHTKWRLALFAGHNVLKNVAGLRRIITPCPSSNSDTFASVLSDTYDTYGGDTERYARDLCDAYSGQNTDRVKEWKRTFHQTKYRKYRRIYDSYVKVRPPCFDTGNNEGPYYHMFAIGIINHYGGALASTGASEVEIIAQMWDSNGRDYDTPYYEMNRAQNRAFIGEVPRTDVPVQLMKWRKVLSKRGKLAKVSTNRRRPQER